MAALIGVSVQKLLGTRLDSLLPPPYNSMHAKWLQDTPPTVPPNSCRAGAVVQLLNSSNVLVPVRLRVHSMEENNRTVHVVRVGAETSERAHARCVSQSALQGMA